MELKYCLSQQENPIVKKMQIRDNQTEFTVFIKFCISIQLSIQCNMIVYMFANSDEKSDSDFQKFPFV